MYSIASCGFLVNDKLCLLFTDISKPKILTPTNPGPLR